MHAQSAKLDLRVTWPHIVGHTLWPAYRCARGVALRARITPALHRPTYRWRGTPGESLQGTCGPFRCRTRFDTSDPRRTFLKTLTTVEKPMTGCCEGGEGPHAGRRALHTCTSWYAYAAMFGSSIQLNVSYSSPSGSIARCLAMFYQPQPLACVLLTGRKSFEGAIVHGVINISTPNLTAATGPHGCMLLTGIPSPSHQVLALRLALCWPDLSVTVGHEGGGGGGGTRVLRPPSHPAFPADMHNSCTLYASVSSRPCAALPMPKTNKNQRLWLSVCTACILRTQRLGYSPKNTCHLFTRGKTERCQYHRVGQVSIDTSGCSYHQQHRRRRTVRSWCRLATIEYRRSRAFERR